MAEYFKSKEYYPVLLYTGFTEREQEDMRYCTTAEKFKRDLQQMLEAGYRPVSLKKIYHLEHTAKYFSIAMTGGYGDNYTVAFPILKELNISASIFVCTDLIGKESYPGINPFTPHFGWKEAQEMRKSGVVDIYAMWHPFDQEKELRTEAAEKIKFLSQNLGSDDTGFAFYYGNINEAAASILNELGIKVILSDCSSQSLNNIHKGILSSTNVEYYTEVLDAISRQKALYEDLLQKEAETKEALVQVNIKRIYDSFNQPSITLPVNKHPMIRNYLRHAFPFTILETERRDRVERFVLNEYIETVYTPAYDWFDYHNTLYTHWDCLRCCTITRDILKANHIDVIEYVINSMNEGYYCDIWLDTYYIPQKPGYMKVHQTHGLLLYGYDNTKKAFSALSYTERALYEELEISIYDFAMACSSPYFWELNLLKRNDGSPIVYNIHLLRDRLNRYVHSVLEDDHDLNYTKKDLGNYYNFHACEYFADSLYDRAKAQGYIHRTSTYGFAEHKKCMAWRIHYICELEKFLTADFDVNAYKMETEKDCEFLVNIGLKYNSTKNDRSLLKASNCAKELVRQEKEAILWLIDKIDEKYADLEKYKRIRN